MKIFQLKIIFCLLQQSTFVLLVSLSSFFLPDPAIARSLKISLPVQTDAAISGKAADSDRPTLDQTSPAAAATDSIIPPANREPDPIVHPARTIAVPELAALEPQFAQAATQQQNGAIAAGRGIVHPGDLLIDTDSLRFSSQPPAPSPLTDPAQAAPSPAVTNPPAPDLPPPSLPTPHSPPSPLPHSPYITPPQIVPDDRVPPLITTLPLNGTVISHLTEWEAAAQLQFGEGRSASFGFEGIVRINSQVEQSLSRDNIFTSIQTGEYLQGRSIRTERRVTVRRREPQTLSGLRIQMSLTASCLLPDQGNPGDQCTYTPGIITDPDSIDPNFFVPTRIVQTADFGEIVTPESLAAMRQPGFQMGANGQEVGLDLLFPNTGAFGGNSQASETSIDRVETIQIRPAGILSRVRQVIRANDRAAVLGRTIRGNVVIVDPENFLLNAAVQFAAEFLPDADPSIEGSASPVNTNINRNLFLAANNVRLPEGITVYHAGIGQAETPVTPTDLSDLPSAHFNSIWIGLSPVTERSLDRTVRYVPTGPTRIVTRAVAEGGVDSNVEFNSLINERIFSTADLEDFYTQIYLTFTRRDVDFVTATTQTERIRFYPHIGFTGNITGSQNIFRYYAGVITADEIKAYLGLDYTYTATSGWTFNAGAIGYLNPDREHYSRLWGNTSYRIRFSNRANLLLSGGFTWALDQQDGIDDVTLDTQGSNVNLAARTNIGPVSVGAVYYFGNLLPNSIADTLILDAGVRIGSTVYLSGYFAPIDRNASRSRYGAKLQWRLGNDHSAPTLIFAWSSYQYDYGADQAGNELFANQNVFSLQMRLGEPPNPFGSRTTERLREQVNQEVDRFRQERDRAIESSSEE